MADNGETATNQVQQEDKVVPLELLNGSELTSAQEGSDGDVVHKVKQDGDGNQLAASGGGDGKGDVEIPKTEGGQDIEAVPAEVTVTEGDANGECEEYSKFGENNKGVDIDKDVDETDKNMIKTEGDNGQAEKMVVDSFPEPQNSQSVDEKEVNVEVLDNSVASSCNIDEDDGYTTTDTDTSQIARDLVQHALDQAILTFHTDASSVPSLSSTQDLNIEESNYDMENNNINIGNGAPGDQKTFETQDSVEEVETEVTFESVKQTEESAVSLNDSQEVGQDNEDDSMRDVSDTEGVVDRGQSSDQQQKAQEDDQDEVLVSAEISSDRGEDSDVSDTEFGGLAKLDPLPQYPDFPENYGNYKVCRSVEPGVKECIILETGECVRCRRSYSGICQTGKCTSVNNKEEIVSEVVDRIPVQDNDNGHLINDIPKNESRSPNVSVSSASSNESGKPKSFRIVKSPNKDGINAYSSGVENSESRRNYDLSSNLVQRDRTDLVNDENYVASITNDTERQFAYLDNLRSSRQEESVLNNRFVPRSTANSQKPSPDISYSRLSASNEGDSITYPRSSQYRHGNQNPELSYQRMPSSEAQQMAQSYSSTSHYSRKYESSPLSDPSVLVRYQRNLISRDFPADLSGDAYQNVTQTSSLSDNDRINSQRKVEERKLDLTKDQFELNQSERELLREIYSKYGQPREQQDSFVSSVSGEYSRNRSTQEVLSSSNSSGHIPSYKTLQEQQASWMSMFHELEQEHQDELRHQYQRHQQAIFNLQQQVERDIHIQEQSFRKKLNAHKELLVENSSPSRLTSDGEHQQSRLTDRSVQDFENKESETREYDSTHNSLFDGRALPTRRETSPWREIYREIRQSIDDIDSSVDGSECSGPVRRSLEREFSSPSQHISQLQTHSKSQLASGSPRSPRSPRDRGTGRKPELTPDGFPRAGVYSSPMPILRNKGRKSTPSGTDVSISQDLNNSVRVSSPSPSEQHHSSLLQRDLESRHKERLQHQEERDTELMGNSTASDVYLSSSTRMNLREKHAKHLSDLREYYEKELSELRSAISTSENIMNQNPYKRVASENQNLHVENRLLKQKVAELEDDLDSANRTIRELEQKVHGLEVRASDYADHLNESQSKLSTFRSKMEEIQYQSREREQLMKELNAKIKYQEEALKNSKKLQEEQADIIVKDQSSVQKMINKYSAVERDYNILKDTLNNTENKLYDARKEVVELNRTVAKLELENKRLGRENDNMCHRHSQSSCMNLSSIQGSFHEVFNSPEEAMNSSISPVRDSPVRDSSVRDSSDSRLLNGSLHKPDDVELPSTPGRPDISQRSTGNNLPRDEDLVASPLMKAEQDVYKLRNMMLSCASGQSIPPEPKLQKKYYGSDIKSNNSSKISDSSYFCGSPRGRREKSPSSLSSRSTKSKSNKYSKSADKSVSSPSQSTPKRSQRPSARFNVEPEEFSNPTRFDVSSNGSPRSRSRSGQRQSGDGQTEKEKRSPKSKINSARGSNDKSVNNSGSSMEDLQSNQPNDKDVSVSVTETLNRVRSGVYVARPEWEDVYTSMAQPKKNNVENPSPVTRIDRMKTIGDMEHRYDDLQLEKRKLESALSKTSSHGKGRIKKEQLENKLDNVEKELGSVRMSLKRWNILKTSS